MTEYVAKEGQAIHNLIVQEYVRFQYATKGEPSAATSLRYFLTEVIFANWKPGNPDSGEGLAGYIARFLDLLCVTVIPDETQICGHLHRCGQALLNVVTASPIQEVVLGHCLFHLIQMFGSDDEASRDHVIKALASGRCWPRSLDLKAAIRAGKQSCSCEEITPRAKIINILYTLHRSMAREPSPVEHQNSITCRSSDGPSSTESATTSAWTPPTARPANKTPPSSPVSSDCTTVPNDSSPERRSPEIIQTRSRSASKSPRAVQNAATSPMLTKNANIRFDARRICRKELFVELDRLDLPSTSTTGPVVPKPRERETSKKSSEKRAANFRSRDNWSLDNDSSCHSESRSSSDSVPKRRRHAKRQRIASASESSSEDDASREVKSKVKWTEAEEERLVMGVQELGWGLWHQISMRFRLSHKTALQLRDKYRNIVQYHHLHKIEERLRK